MLRLSHVQFDDKKKRRVLDMSFQVDQGEILALFGHNGSGKSTLLNMLAGVLPIKQGQVSFMGSAAIQQNGFIKKEVRAQSGVLFQGTSSDIKLSIKENYLYAARLMGLSLVAAKKASEALLCHADLMHRADDQTKTLSGGLMRKMELYRTFLHNPKLLILDEPTAGLDVKEARRFFLFLKDYVEKNKAIVVVATHNPDEALMAHRVVMLKSGLNIASGEPHKMLASLSFLRCKIIYHHAPAQDEINKDFWFDVAMNDDKAVLEAKIHEHQVATFLASPVAHAPWVRSFSLSDPSLADVYDKLPLEQECRL